MKHLTAKEIEHEIGVDGIIFGSGNKPTYTTKQRIEMIKQYAKDACERQIGNCHADLRRQVQKEGLKITIDVLNSVLNAEIPELL